MIFRLPPDEIVFPDPSLAEEDGLLAIGGDLSIERLLLAYENGIFPWYSEEDPILWFSPHERCVIYPDKVKISKSMKKVIQLGAFKVSVNQNFKQVIKHCAVTPRKDQPGTWITTEMQEAYIKLHNKGFAHSIEVWQEEKLVGGLYGVRINRVFCGESMFSLVPNASKMALIYLCKSLDFDLIDCQLPNEHLLSMGAEMIDREVYMSFIKGLVK
ncbi:leucyl/phenylalanyl-tRNA--protein transferase [Pedobacter montanisoli]|uniref:Leucyl/phenylalanyl-tRNA--protein transferase n=1 Tax=Pedobacter montanisoli TaxID=2923277 RepID=A0ABS9ZTA3_9SPHI|nr:leucyl/phenylalanyl-tRNA--protein transferase [Pedobacter montanisoli]MCJ0741597.1 leucyl/phenylalanyl-tRNA--protein transferase [Pedobacter montanisoli]